MATTVREYAKMCRVSYEAVRQQLVRYEDELAGHIDTRGRVKVLDDFAVDFLNERRQGNPVTVNREAHDAEFEELRAENRTLLLKAAAQAEALAAAYKQVADATAARITAERSAALLDAAKDDRQAAEERAKAAEAEAAELRQALDAERAKTWLQKLMHG